MSTVNVPDPVEPAYPPMRILYTLAAVALKLTRLWRPQESSLQASSVPTQLEPAYTAITVSKEAPPQVLTSKVSVDAAVQSNQTSAPRAPQVAGPSVVAPTLLNGNVPVP